MNIMIIGEPYFAKNLSASLSKYDNENRYFLYEKDHNKFTKIKSFLVSDVIYFIGGVIENNKLINLALTLNKKVYMHWVGTDVLHASSVYKNKGYNLNYIDKVTHFSEVSWIQEELNQIGIKSEVVQFATFNNKISSSLKLPEQFSILSYVGKNREEFYGIKKLIKLAYDFPNIKINIVGISDYREKYPDNIKFLGRVNNMDYYYQNCVLYLRLVEHDGLAFSVLEALANGRYVGYSYDFNNVIHIKNHEKLFEVVKDLHNKFLTNELPINQSGINFVRENFAEKVVLENLINKLTKK